MNLIGRSAVVTGSARGIGRGIALKLAEEGASVVVNGTTPEAIDETVKLIKKQNGKAIGITADITKKVDVERMMEETVNTFGSVDILVNNAGTHKDAMMLKMTEEEWDYVVDVMLKGTFFCTQTAARYMRKNKFGRIITISSEGAWYGNMGMINYVTGKAGQFGFTLTAARELAMYSRKEGSDITCNCITPGYNDTRITQAVPKKIDAKFRDAIVMGRIADSKEDIGGVVAFLASEEASYITGAIIAAGGGEHLNLAYIS